MDFLQEYLAFLKRHARLWLAFVAVACVVVLVLLVLMARSGPQPFVYTPF